MNCKPGDLAVFVRSDAGNEGRIIECVRLATRTELIRGGFITRFGPVWVTREPLIATSGIYLPFAIDAYLRPIRDPGDDAQDETLQWLPVPSKEGTPA
jgi:hypothetical protein